MKNVTDNFWVVAKKLLNNHTFFCNVSHCNMLLLRASKNFATSWVHQWPLCYVLSQIVKTKMSHSNETLVMNDPS